MTIGLLIVMTYVACYCFGVFFDVRKKHGVVTVAGLIQNDTEGPIAIFRRIVQSRGEELRRIEVFLLFLAYASVIGTLIVGIGAVIVITVLR